MHEGTAGRDPYHCGPSLYRIMAGHKQAKRYRMRKDRGRLTADKSSPNQRQSTHAATPLRNCSCENTKCANSIRTCCFVKISCGGRLSCRLNGCASRRKLCVDPQDALTHKYIPRSIASCIQRAFKPSASHPHSFTHPVSPTTLQPPCFAQEPVGHVRFVSTFVMLKPLSGKTTLRQSLNS